MLIKHAILPSPFTTGKNKIYLEKYFNNSMHFNLISFKIINYLNPYFTLYLYYIFTILYIKHVICQLYNACDERHNLYGNICENV